MSRGSSRRLIPEPKSVAMSGSILARAGRALGWSPTWQRSSAPVSSVAMSGSLLARAGRGLDRGDDVLIARAAAQISLERVADLGLGRLGLRREQIGRRHDHAGSAKAALQPVLLPKRLLQRVQAPPSPSPSVAAQTLDGRDRVPLPLQCEHGAALYRPAVDMDRAGAALARSSARLRNREVP